MPTRTTPRVSRAVATGRSTKRFEMFTGSTSGRETADLLCRVVPIGDLLGTGIARQNGHFQARLQAVLAVCDHRVACVQSGRDYGRVAGHAHDRHWALCQSHVGLHEVDVRTTCRLLTGAGRHGDNVRQYRALDRSVDELA